MAFLAGVGLTAPAQATPAHRRPGPAHPAGATGPHAVRLLDRRTAVRLTPLHVTPLHVTPLRLAAAPAARTAARTGPGERPRQARPAASRPLISSMTPAQGAPGWPVTLSGRRFRHITSVSFGGQTAQFEVISATQITTVVPSSRDQRADHRDRNGRERPERDVYGHPGDHAGAGRDDAAGRGAAIQGRPFHADHAAGRQPHVLRDRHRPDAVGQRHRRALRRLPVHAEQRQPGPVRQERRQDPVVDRDRRARPSRPGRPGQREPGPVRRHGADLERGQPGQQAHLGRDPAAGLVPQLRHRLPPGHAHQREPGPDPRGPHGVVQRDRGPPRRHAHHAGPAATWSWPRARRCGPAAPAATPGPG